MRLRDHRHLAAPLLPWLLAISVSLSYLSDPVIAKKSEPRVTKNTFSELPAGLTYFPDSDVILVHDRLKGEILRSKDAGETWDTADIPESKAAGLERHPFDPNVAFVLSAGHHHWYTPDRGESWKQFKTAASPSPWRNPLRFHASDPKKIIFQAEACQSFFECDEISLYTTDGFETDPKLLRTGTRGCSFARATDIFTTGDRRLDEDRIICISRGRYSPWPKDNRLVVSDSYFEDEFEPELEIGRTVKGLLSAASVKKFIVVAAKSEGTDEMALYVSDDSKQWHRAEFPDHKVEEGAYTVLESTNYSIQVDVMNTRPSNPMGVLFTSNSNGTYFTKNIEHTNRNRGGLVDFEKVQGIQGIVLVNTVENWKEVEKGNSVKKKIQSTISFDDGRTFQPLKVGKKDLHLHSVTNLHNSGRVFSSPAPGIVMGVGSTGDHLKPYTECDLFVSDDAGVTWNKAADGPHKYEFGDQGSVLMAVADDGPTDTLIYSINHGKDWKKADLGKKVRARLLTTAPDSTSLKFVLEASDPEEKGKHYIFTIDFDELHERKCKSDDFEKWYARVDKDGKPDCLMGRKEFYTRRKADADCFIESDFEDPAPEFEICECADEDFECDFNFVKDGDKCVLASGATMLVPDGKCEESDDTFMGSSGYRLIPGNECKRAGGKQKDDLVEQDCGKSFKAPASGKISHTAQTFKTNKIHEWHYLERADSVQGDDETIVMRTDDKIWITKDHGKEWKEILSDKEIANIYPHHYNNDVVFFTTADTKTVYYSVNRGDRIDSFEAPQPPTTERVPALGFHPAKKDWLIWTGAKNCERSGGDCHSVAYYSTDRGDHWETLLRYVRKCQFIAEEGRGRVGSIKEKQKVERLIYCEQHEGEDKSNNLQLVASNSFFDESKVHFTDIVSFATMAEFIVVAAKDKEKATLTAAASVDGWNFATALFPPDFHVPHQHAYTVLDSSTHAVSLHVTISDDERAEYGAILKSNSNGTSYVMSVNAVNRNRPGYVDFEKVKGLEGVATVNIVANTDRIAEDGMKKLKTMITHNDGAEWGLLPPPAKDADGNSFECSGDIEKCSLHLHAYTERRDARDTYSSPSAVGMMIGVGNVGEHLTAQKEGDTFFSRDGGMTWENIRKGRYLWEYGDSGSIIVIVAERTPTDVVLYSLDEGRTWQDYRFSEEKLHIEELSTIPSDKSRNFLLWGRDPDAREREVTTINLDFTGLTDTICQLDEEHPEDGDYYLWQPKHPENEDECIFGHVAQYHRKRPWPEAQCYTGRQVEGLHGIERNCSCTRHDFECDYNYIRNSDNSCTLIAGLDPPDHSQICRTDPDATQYYTPTGYRRIPLSTCQGGRELEFQERLAEPCPGHEEQFEKTHRGLSGLTLFFLVLVPFGVAAAAGWWVWTHWDGKFGRIQLGSDPSTGGATFDTGGNSPWIQYPVMAVAVVVAVAAAVPDVLSRVWRYAQNKIGSRGGYGRVGRYTTRDSFARGRGGDYDAVVGADEDEGELLGEDSDEEV
ncbi:MAG: vacuolar protein sorting/targeting protein PEP1 [Caeruleum heppii]|nr:MAG: vacuolar protein sorting/targeting protein PEP1 [Caeruleum heppii]